MEKREENHKGAEYLKDVKKKLEQDEGQDKIDKTMRVLRKMPNWKAPCPDNVHVYSLKRLTPLYEKLLVYLQDCLVLTVVTPNWLTKGLTVFIQKDKAKGNIARNYGTITCLPLVWKY